MSLADPVVIGDCRVLVGACSWASRSLTQESSWYPKKTMKAADRLAYYASRFPLVEVESTYWFPPTPEVTRQWVERTPDGFTMDVRAWSLFTGQPTLPPSLWEDLQPSIRPEARDNNNLYAAHLPTDVVAEAWRRFDHALRPLHDSGRLGAVLLQYPHWFTPKDETKEELVSARDALADYRVSVEFGTERWTEPDQLDDTIELFEDHDMILVAVDAPTLPPVVAATGDVAIVRLHGRAHPPWGPRPHRPTWRTPYRYTAEELSEWVPRIVELATSARQVHVLLNNCHRDDAVVNAQQLVEILRAHVAR
ncbi:MAG: DUF72 domain-containing protein [Actinobacteria bacterium]|nr:DUF72 domain-containing protein [Actinomycetota bacterium]